MNYKSIAIASAILLSAVSSNAAEYVCKVYCNSGSTEVLVNASSKRDAAEKIDPTPVANRICKEAGKGNASSSTMSGDQCYLK